VKTDRQIGRRTISGRQPPLSRRQIEDGLLIAILKAHALDEIDEGRAEEIDHAFIHHDDTTSTTEKDQ
jgi:hypothetical protein